MSHRGGPILTPHLTSPPLGGEVEGEAKGNFVVVY